MPMPDDIRGRFTLPGEAGWEALTLSLAERWGADVIRDSDGTQLSDELLGAGYGIYSTICIIRGHNAWIKANMDARQQCFLCTEPRVASGPLLSIRLMEDFFDQQFSLNEDALAFMQVYDRTTGKEVPAADWTCRQGEGIVEIRSVPFHRYTVSFLAWRDWEEISMYNHTTNLWETEHLLQLDPFHDKAMDYITAWLDAWCRAHPHTTVVRLTSLFYNFAWIWGSRPRRRHLFSDWASYDFTVSVPALRAFEKEYGYALRAEDFVNGGRYHATHAMPDSRKRDWMEFIGRFVRGAGRRLVDIVHAHGKQAYVFYDDSWVGMEPWNGHFEEFRFDGLIKCVFSGFEVRLCAGAPVETHELRLHPYLFPVGLGGAPTFSPGGTPDADAKKYWVSVRRALLRAKIDRIGLGGYLHYIEEYPLFAQVMDEILIEFRRVAALREAGPALLWQPRVGILTAWGSLRSWTLSGHFHETDRHVLIHIIESLAGMPLDVKFLSFEDVEQGALGDIDLLINAGRAGSAWSGGTCWESAEVQTLITAWVHNGGTFLGVQEPSACPGGDSYFRMAHVLGVDRDTGDRCCHGKWPVRVQAEENLVPPGAVIQATPDIYLTAEETLVLLADEANNPLLTKHAFGQGMGIYLAGYQYTPEHVRLLQNLLPGGPGEASAENLFTECAVFPAAGQVVFINNSACPRQTACTVAGKRYAASLAPYGMEVVSL